MRADTRSGWMGLKSQARTYLRPKEAYFMSLKGDVKEGRDEG